MSDLDAIVIGAGHNGLTCAAYLGMAGLRVRVVERRGVVGGAAVTEEFWPGFRNSTAAYAVSLLQPKIIRDLKLHEHGLRIVERRAQNFLPLPDGRYLLTGEGRSENEIAKFSAKDAARYGAYQAEIGRVADVLRSLVLAAPPNLALRNFGDSARQLGKLAAIGKRLWRDDAVTAAFGLLRKSAGDVLDGWFESDPIKAVLGFDAVVGNLASPYTPGSAYVLLHHVFGEVNGKRGAWGHAIGGMGAITQAMASAAGAQGVRIDVRAAVREVIVERDRATGVVLDDGTAIRARAVIANVNPQHLFQALVPPRRGARRDGRTHEKVEDRLRHLPHEPGAGETAGFFRAPRTGRPSHRGHHHGAEPVLHGPGLSRLRPPRLEPGADRRDADPVEPRRHARAARRPCGEPVLPARRAAIRRRLVMGPAPRNGRRPDDRHGRDLCARLQVERASGGKALRRSTSSASSACPTATFSTAR